MSPRGHITCRGDTMCRQISTSVATRSNQTIYLAYQILDQCELLQVVYPDNPTTTYSGRVQDAAAGPCRHTEPNKFQTCSVRFYSWFLQTCCALQANSGVTVSDPTTPQVVENVSPVPLCLHCSPLKIHRRPQVYESSSAYLAILCYSSL